MKSDFAQFVFSIIALIFCGAAEELFPKFFSVGFPFLLMASLFLAPRRTTLAAILFSVAAGSFADSLSSLPFATSICFFTLATLVSRTREISYGIMAIAFPLYQIWIWIWRPGVEGGIFGRILASFFLGPITALIVMWFLLWLERKAAINER